MTSIACHLRLSAGFTAPPYHLRAPCDQGGGRCDGYGFRWHVGPGVNHGTALQRQRVEQLAQLHAVGVRRLVLAEPPRSGLGAQHVGDLPADVNA